MINGHRNEFFFPELESIRRKGLESYEDCSKYSINVLTIGTEICMNTMYCNILGELVPVMCERGGFPAGSNVIIYEVICVIHF